MPDRTVADNIRAIMALRRVTQVQLAANLKIAQSTLSQRQLANSWPASDLPTVARVLDVPVADLYTGVEPTTPAERADGSAA